jgi:hypothetical protein
LLAVRQTDIKQVLAYTTLMALGALTLFIGAGSSDAIKAAMMFLVVHSLYKAALFLMIGLVDHETGTREVDKLRGLATHAGHLRRRCAGRDLHGRHPALLRLHRQGVSLQGGAWPGGGSSGSPERSSPRRS